MLSVALALWLQDWYSASKSSAPRRLSPSPASSCRTSRTWPRGFGISQQLGRCTESCRTIGRPPDFCRRMLTSQGTADRLSQASLNHGHST